MILEEGIQEENGFFLKYGQLTAVFANWLKSNEIRYKNFNRVEKLLYLGGCHSNGDFFNLLESFRPNYNDIGIKFLYREEGYMHDESFKFGDAFNSLFLSSNVAIMSSR